MITKLIRSVTKAVLAFLLVIALGISMLQNAGGESSCGTPRALIQSSTKAAGATKIEWQEFTTDPPSTSPIKKMYKKYKVEVTVNASFTDGEGEETQTRTYSYHTIDTITADPDNVNPQIPYDWWPDG